MSARCRFALTLIASLLFVGQAALATTAYPDYFGPNVSFTGIQETSSFGDPEPLFGAPTGSLDQLLFFPANFTANAIGAGGYDATGAQLQATITATALNATIDQLLIDEFGDRTLLGPGGTGGTGVFAAMSGFVTVLEVLGVPIAPVVIGFNAGAGVNGSFSPAALGATGLYLPGSFGTGLWSGSVYVDIASIVPNATKVALSFDNDLYAFSELASNSAKIQKKVVDGPAIVVTVIPEPGTFALLCGGLLALSLRGRSRRS
jgi:hypothetical protein